MANILEMPIYAVAAYLLGLVALVPGMVIAPLLRDARGHYVWLSHVAVLVLGVLMWALFWAV
jgi:hypothetical protein